MSTCMGRCMHMHMAIYICFQTRGSQRHFSFRPSRRCLSLITLLPHLLQPRYTLHSVIYTPGMDIEVSANELKKGEYSSHKKLKENCVLVEAKHVVELQPASIVAADEVPSLEPVTPDSNRESGDLPLDFTSPLTLVSSSLDVVIDFDSHKNVELCASIDDSPRTPKEGVFDPFAPGPDKLMLAPQCNKYLQESQGNVARRLNLDPFVKCAGNESRVSDKVSISDLDEVMLLEKVYAALLEEIVSAQTGEVLVAPLDLVSDSFKTPSSSARLSGVAETCPAAPMKPTRKLRNIDPVLCRKLQF